MESTLIIIPFFLGLLEGLTEFLPVSSTGHLLLAGHFLKFESPGKIFQVLIQLGAVLALPCVYRNSLRSFLSTIHIPPSKKFLTGIFIGCLPAAIIGASTHDAIKSVLFETPRLICIMLIAGGIVLLWVDRLSLDPRYFRIGDFPVRMCLRIGLFQALAIIPGVSRSGATIIGALMSGANRKSATEFSFLLSVPVIAGAVLLDLFKNARALSPGDIPVLATGFLTAFITAFFLCRWVVEYISKHGYSLFGWWRIILGCIGLLALQME